MPALLKAKVSVEDDVNVSLSPGMKRGFMVKSDFMHELGGITSKVFPSESTARSYAQGQEVIKVDVIWVP